MSRECAIIRCTEIGYSEKKIYNALAHIFPTENIYYVLNAEGRNSIGNVLILDTEFIELNQLASNIPKVGWRCGDYAFYRMFQHDNSFDYYWMFESDLAFTVDTLSKFMTTVVDKPLDLLAPYFRKRNETWDWSKKLSAAYPSYEIYGCLFSMIRLSGKALGFMLEERVKLSTKTVSEVAIKNFPNDESFTCSVLKNNGFSCEAFKGLDRGSFSLTRIHRRNVDDSVISHPVMENYTDMIKKSRMVYRAASHQLIKETNKNLAVNSGDINVFNSLSWLASDIQINNSIFNESPTISCVTGRNVEGNSVGIASIADLILAGGGVVEEVDYKRFSPYSFENDYLYLVDTHAEDFKKPFLYQSQRANCTSLIRTKLRDVKLPNIDKSKLTFIFSIGRCGSTLLSKLMSSVNYNEISESDIYSSSQNSELINKTIKIFLQHNSMIHDKSSFKFRSQTNEFVDKYIEIFKESNFIFLYRGKEDWARSFSGKFGWNDAQLAHAYKQGANTLNKLLMSQVNLKVIKYENLIDNPYLFLDHAPTKSEVSAIDRVLSVDSQALSGINNSDSSFDKDHVSAFLKNVHVDLETQVINKVNDK